MGKLFSQRWILILVFLPILLLIYMILKYGVNVPFGDQWDFIPLIEKSYIGTLTFGDFWAQHNEHRLIFPRLIMLALSRLSRWNIFHELWVNIILALAIFKILTMLIYETFKGAKINNFWFIPVISVMIFSLNQSSNWLSGWQMQIFLNILATVGGIKLLSAARIKWPSLISAIILGIVATYSFANGLLFWPIGFFMITTSKGQNLYKKMILWASIWFVVYFSYLWGYSKPYNHPSLWVFIHNPVNFLLYILVYLGRPVTAFAQTNVGQAQLAGFLGLVFLILSLIVLGRARNVTFQLIKPYIAISIYALASAIITALGRAGFGLWQALSGHYISISNLFWIANGVFFCLLLNFVSNKKDKSRKIIEVFLMLISIIFIIMVITSSIGTTYGFKSQNKILNKGRSTLLEGKPYDQMRELYYNEKLMKERILILKKYKLSLFKNYFY